MDALKALDRAWKTASQDGPPTTHQLRLAGAPLDHSGLVILALKVTESSALPGSSYRFVQSGGAYEAQIGQPVVGYSVDDLVHPAHLARLIALYDDICATKTPHQWTCLNLVRNAPAKSYTRLLVPISDDAGDGRCLLGIWIWQQTGKADPNTAYPNSAICR